MAVAGCGDDSSGTGGSGATGGDGGGGGSAATGGSGGSAGTGGSGGSGGMNAGCEDDVGGRPALTGQPSVTPSTVAKGGSITASAPVNGATKYVLAFVSSAFNETEGSAATTTNGGETVELQIDIRPDANTGDLFFVGFNLCTSEAECSGGTRNTVQYRDGDNVFYSIIVTDNGASIPAAGGFSDCNELLELTITN
jgi:hypothetical protein